MLMFDGIKMKKLAVFGSDKRLIKPSRQTSCMDRSFELSHKEAIAPTWTESDRQRCISLYRAELRDSSSCTSESRAITSALRFAESRVRAFELLLSLATMAVRSVCVGTAVDGATGRRHVFPAATACEEDQDDRNDGKHQHEACYRNANGKVALRYADAVGVVWCLQKETTKFNIQY
ncbi:hypothetical protein C0J52_19083 [Blattella germanica]|nr:hypothetical protein C0J52_19083 [Blattella germanica]